MHKTPSVVQEHKIFPNLTSEDVARIARTSRHFLTLSRAQQERLDRQCAKVTRNGLGCVNEHLRNVYMGSNCMRWCKEHMIDAVKLWVQIMLGPLTFYDKEQQFEQRSHHISILKQFYGEGTLFHYHRVDKRDWYGEVENKELPLTSGWLLDGWRTEDPLTITAEFRVSLENVSRVTTLDDPIIDIPLEIMKQEGTNVLFLLEVSNIA